VLTLRYRRLYDVIEDPQPGGPYLSDANNLTDTVTLRVGDASYELGLLTDTPIRVEIEPQRPGGARLIALAGVAVAAAAVAAYMYRRGR
jgi:hypothetical protein